MMKAIFFLTLISTVANAEDKPLPAPPCSTYLSLIFQGQTSNAAVEARTLTEGIRVQAGKRAIVLVSETVDGEIRREWFPADAEAAMFEARFFAHYFPPDGQIFETRLILNKHNDWRDKFPEQQKEDAWLRMSPVSRVVPVTRTIRNYTKDAEAVVMRAKKTEQEPPQDDITHWKPLVVLTHQKDIKDPFYQFEIFKEENTNRVIVLIQKTYHMRRHWWNLRKEKFDMYEWCEGRLTTGDLSEEFFVDKTDNNIRSIFIGPSGTAQIHFHDAPNKLISLSETSGFMTFNKISSNPETVQSK